MEHEDDTMEKQLICDITDAVELKYVKTTRWVWAGVDNGLFRPGKKGEPCSLEIEHYDVVFDPSSADEDEKLPVPYSVDRLNCIEGARKIGEALSLEDHSPFLITINGRKYYQHWWNIHLDGNEVINWRRYLGSSVSKRCPDGWADELPDYLDYHYTLYRAETEETKEE